MLDALNSYGWEWIEEERELVNMYMIDEELSFPPPETQSRLALLAALNFAMHPPQEMTKDIVPHLTAFVTSALTANADADPDDGLLSSSLNFHSDGGGVIKEIGHGEILENTFHRIQNDMDMEEYSRLLTEEFKSGKFGYEQEDPDWTSDVIALSIFGLLICVCIYFAQSPKKRPSKRTPKRTWEQQVLFLLGLGEYNEADRDSYSSSSGRRGYSTSNDFLDQIQDFSLSKAQSWLIEAIRPPSSSKSTQDVLIGGKIRKSKPPKPMNNNSSESRGGSGKKRKTGSAKKSSKVINSNPNPSVANFDATDEDPSVSDSDNSHFESDWNREFTSGRSERNCNSNDGDTGDSSSLTSLALKEQLQRQMTLQMQLSPGSPERQMKGEHNSGTGSNATTSSPDDSILMQSSDSGDNLYPIEVTPNPTPTHSPNSTPRCDSSDANKSKLHEKDSEINQAQLKYSTLIKTQRKEGKSENKVAHKRETEAAPAVTTRETVEVPVLKADTPTVTTSSAVPKAPIVPIHMTNNVSLNQKNVLQQQSPRQSQQQQQQQQRNYYQQQQQHSNNHQPQHYQLQQQKQQQQQQQQQHHHNHNHQHYHQQQHQLQQLHHHQQHTNNNINNNHSININPPS
jgi:hypothetical protein